ncbi:MAG: rhomboid family intramembrane serine protease, partial [Methylocystis sp.]
KSVLGLRAPLFSFVASGWLFVGAWILMQLINASMGEGGAIAWMAHVGGIAAGLVLTPLFKRRRHRLFDRGGPLASTPSPPDAGDDAP